MFIVFEGPEGSGKSTQAQLLADHLGATGRKPILTREPGGTRLGEVLRGLLMNNTDLEVTPRAEVLLFSAARAQLVDKVIAPALAAGHIVICDRFSDSTLAYQAYGRGLDPAGVKSVVGFATAGLAPDLVVLLDLPPERGFQRKPAAVDRFEMESPRFHERVRQGYLEMARQSPERWFVVDAGRDVYEVAGDVRAKVDSVLGERSTGKTIE